MPEPERDPQIEKLVDEIFVHHGITTPMKRQVLREMATKLVCREVRISIVAKMSEKLWVSIDDFRRCHPKEVIQ
jgi:hypothetical protein